MKSGLVGLALGLVVSGSLLMIVNTFDAVKARVVDLEKRVAKIEANQGVKNAK